MRSTSIARTASPAVETLTGYADDSEAKRQGSGSPRIAYWMFNYEPKWEAVSQEVQILRDAFDERFGTRIISLNLRFRGSRLTGTDKHLTPIPGLLAFPMLMRSARTTPINHIFASPGGTFLTRLLVTRSRNTILTIAKDSPDLDELDRNSAVLRALRYVVVESERHRDLMSQLGLPGDRVRLIYPGVEPNAFQPAPGPFTILFATAPLHKSGLLSRGVHLMIQAAKRLPDVRFQLVWRRHPERVRDLIRSAEVSNVEVIEGYVADMGARYDSAHATILPGLESSSLKPCPHSGLESLARGKPILASRSTSYSGIVERQRCGVVFDATVDSLCAAIRCLQENYAAFQANALPTSQQYFSRSQFIDRYAALYASILDPAA